MENDMNKIIEIGRKFHQLNYDKLYPEISKGEWILLMHLQNYEQFEDQTKENQQPCPRYFADIMHYSPPMISKILRSLEKKEMIVRKLDEKDRRNTNIFLTDKGKEWISKGKERRNLFFENVIEQLGKEKMDTMVATLEEFYDIAKKEIEKMEEK